MKLKKVKYTENVKSNDYCFRCGSYDVKVLSTGERVCQKSNCLTITKIDLENNKITTKFKVQENEIK